MFLADLGAEVIKIENAATGGDAGAQVGPHFLGEDDSAVSSRPSTSTRRASRSTCKSAEGQRRFAGWSRRADAVMNNLRGDQPAKLGLDYATLAHVNPAIVCVHLSAYGRDNERAALARLRLPDAGRGRPDAPDRRARRPPARIGALDRRLHDRHHRRVGLLGGVLGARTTGKGCDIDVCLFDVALHQLGYSAPGTSTRATSSTRQPRSAHPSRHAGADLPDRGRLDLRHVHDRQVLGRAGRARSAVRSSTPTRASRRSTARREQPR